MDSIHHDKELGFISVTEEDTCLQVMMDHTLIVIGARQHSVYERASLSVEVKRQKCEHQVTDGTERSSNSSESFLPSAFNALFVSRTWVFLEKCVTDFGCEASQKICGSHE